MRGSNHMERMIDNKFQRIVSNDSFRQYLGLSFSAQKRLREQFEDIFMPSFEDSGTTQSEPSSFVYDSASKQG